MGRYRGAAALVIVVILLALSLLIFNPSFASALEKVEKAAESLGRLIPERGAELTEIRVKVLFSDQGSSQLFLGNETTDFKPVGNAVVLVGGYVALTDENGEATLKAPKGNVTIHVSRNKRNYWRGVVDIDGNETIIVKFILYRLTPLDVKVDLSPFKITTPVTLSFKTPLQGRYYVGKPHISFYTPWGELRMVPETLDEGIDYRTLAGGGTPLVIREKVVGNPVYILPDSTYLPVERVELEEKP